MKRKASDPVDLTADSDADCSSADDSNRASTSTSTSKTSKNNKKKKVAAPRHLEVAQSLAKSEGLGPRSVLLGGAGTGQEHAGRLKVSQKIVAADDDDQAAAPPPKPKRRTVHRETPNQILPFKVESKNNEGPAELIAKLAYGEPHLYLLGRVKDGRGRRKKHEYSDSDEDDDDADKPFTIETLVGPDPDKHVQSVMWIAPKVQTPWLPKQFKTAHLSKARDENAGHESLSDGDVDATDDKKKEGKKVKKPQKVQAPTKKSLLVVCGVDGSSSAEAATVIHHAKPQEGFGASFSIVRCAPSSFGCRDRGLTWTHSLSRSFATPSPKRTICASRSVDPRPRPKLGRASSTRSGCRTCRDSLSLRRPLTQIRRTPSFHDRFLRSDSLALCTSDENSKAASDALVQLERNLCRFDFSSTENLRLVVSHAGSHDGEDKVAEAGGLTSLANAIASLSPSCDGQGDWKIEYLVSALQVLRGSGHRLAPQPRKTTCC